MLGCFVLCSMYTLLWLICPCLGLLSKIMSKYRKYIQQKNVFSLNDWTKGQNAANNQINFVDYDMENIYFNNRDMKLLLDLLSTCSGIEQALRILVLFDSKLKSYFCPGDLKFVDQSHHAYLPVNEINISTNDGVLEDSCTKKLVYDVSVEFSEAKIMANFLKNIPDLVTIYTVEIYPRTPRSTIHKSIKSRIQNGQTQFKDKNTGHIFTTRLYDMDPEKRYFKT